MLKHVPLRRSTYMTRRFLLKFVTSQSSARREMHAAPAAVPAAAPLLAVGAGLRRVCAIMGRRSLRMRSGVKNSSSAYRYSHTHRGNSFENQNLPIFRGLHPSFASNHAAVDCPNSSANAPHPFGICRDAAYRSNNSVLTACGSNSLLRGADAGFDLGNVIIVRACALFIKSVCHV